MTEQATDSLSRQQFILKVILPMFTLSVRVAVRGFFASIGVQAAALRAA